jgi:hypothetical protein
MINPFLNKFWLRKQCHRSWHRSPNFINNIFSEFKMDSKPIADADEASAGLENLNIA